ncbi:MAG: hypothetical protein VX951_01855 [Planctomycetota bacterium]|nr:hypothetical protein [Planctomycetota bacterium]
MKASLTVLASLITLSSVFAQQNIVYNDPNPAGGNAFPFGSEGIRYQSVMEGAKLTQALVPVVVRDLFVYGRSNGLLCSYEDIEIRMGVTSAPHNAMLATDWATNNPNPTTVYRGPLAINFQANVWSGIGLPVPYTFIPTAATDNLCLEVIVHSAKKMVTGTSSNFYFAGASSTVFRAFRYKWTAGGNPPPMTGAAGQCVGFLLNNGNFAVHGQYGISSAATKVEISGSTYPQPGKLLTINLTGGGPYRTSFLAFGFTYAPFDMTVMGAPRSNIWFNPLISVATVSDANGAAAIPLVIPTTLTTGTVFAQWYQVDPGAYQNTLGLVTSDCATIIFGQ